MPIADILCDLVCLVYVGSFKLKICIPVIAILGKSWKEKKHEN